MSESDTENQGPLHVTDTYSGKLFWLNPPSGRTLDIENLKNELQERTFREDISDQFDQTNLVVPTVFQQDGQMVRTTTTEDVQLVSFDDEDVMTGRVVLDQAKKIAYRDNEILVLDTAEVNFMIFNQGGFYYLSILAPRELANTVINILRAEFPELGSTINSTRLGPDAISNIRDSLNAVLMDTIITDYDQSEITQTRIQGENYDETDLYDQIDRGGRVKSHMFQSDVLVPDQTKTIQIGRDGLVRIYSNSTLQTYLKLLKNHVIPEVHRDVSSSPSVSAWDEASDATDHSIFQDT
jgi:hypothetical protein